MSVRFAMPEILFLGQSDQAERAFMVKLLEICRNELGLVHFHEPCCGSFALSLVARSLGYGQSEITASDVGLYSTVIGALLTERDLAELEVAIDGTPVQLDGTTLQQAATILWWQLLLRIEAKPEVDYWRELAADLYFRGAEHRVEIAKALERTVERLKGIDFRTQDLWDHLIEASRDRHAVIVAAPPSYKGGYEKFYDTAGRLRWNEPSYSVFEPESGYHILQGFGEKCEALFVFYQYGPPGSCVGDPIYVRHTNAGEYLYLVCNRPEDVFAISKGPWVVPRSGRAMEPGPWPIIPSDWEPGGTPQVEVVVLPHTQSAYYRQLWMHRIASRETGISFGVLVDGYMAGVAGISFDSMTMPLPSAKWTDAPILRYAVGAPHHTYRLTRLVTRLALSRKIVRQIATPGVQLHATAADKMVTIAYTQYPESKGLRGLMKMIDRVPAKPEGYKLVYAAELTDEDEPMAIEAWFQSEAKWQKARAS